MLRWLPPALMATLCLTAGGCRRRTGVPPPAPATAEAALHQLAEVGSDGALLYDVLDQDSRWSVMTVHRDLRRLCELVRASYPKERQARELARCHAAESSPDPRAFFAAQAPAWGMLARLQGVTGSEPLQGSGALRTAAARGGPLRLCGSEQGWGYCGLREELEGMKLKAARDLATVQENAEAYKGR